MSRDISKVSESAFLSSKPMPYLPYLDEDQSGQAWSYKIKRKFFVWKKNVRQQRPLLEGFVEVEMLLKTRKRDMHVTPCDISSGLTENIIKTKMRVRTTSTVILACYNSIMKQ